jgi:hypothetical protein
MDLELLQRHQNSQQFLTERLKVTGRKRGTCSMCCQLLKVPEAGKVDHQWCPHAL